MQWWIYAVLTMVLFGITNFLLKVAGEGGMDSVFAANLIWLSAGAVGLIFLIYGIYTGRFQKEWNESRFLITLPIIAGITLALGMYFIKKAVTLGEAGPSVAIASSNALIVAFLAYLFLGEGLSATKIGGMFLIIMGIVIMALL